MWHVYAEIELINGKDLALARRSNIGEVEIKSISVNILVDTTSVYMCINENIQEQLRLPIIGQRKRQQPDGPTVECDVVGPIEVRFKNRRCTVNALVLPGDSEPLLGAMALEEMDVLIHPYQRELIVNPDNPYFGQMQSE